MSAPTTALASATPLSPPTTGSSLNNTSTLLFGFLVTALSIFAIFMTTAIIWNRLVARRRAIDATLAISPPALPQRLHRPTMWDVWTVPHKQPPLWVDIKPVAAQGYSSLTGTPRVTQTARTMSFWRHRLLDCFPPEITYLFRQPIFQTSVASIDTNVPQIELSHESDIQISLLICMPHAPHSSQERKLHDMVLATSNVVYHDSNPS